MKNINLEQVNNAILTLENTNLDEEFYSQLSESAKILMKADYVKLSLFEDERLRRKYYSDDLIKQNVLTTNKIFNTLLSTKEIFLLTQKNILQMRFKRFPPEIKSIVVVSLIHSKPKKLLGFFVLYFRHDKQILSKNEREILILYSHTAALALNKAQLQEESQKALEIRDRFISLASHELRTPLTSIHGYIQLLHNRMKDKKSLESRWTEELYIESIRLTTLVKELLDVNRIKQGQFAFVFSEVSLQEIAKRAIERYRLTDSNHLFEFQCKLIDHQTRVVGDFDKLVEMTSGLLGNAVKFSKPGEKITITLKTIPGMLSLEVKDRGKGISREDLIAIQNGFYKPEYANFMEGMGVGIMVARHIVENHRGKLKIKSKENEGTTVIVKLPTIKTNYKYKTKINRNKKFEALSKDRKTIL